VHIALFEPEIPANTGNIARLCAVTACRLHLIRPLGFFLDDKRLKRAGLDYWDKVDLQVHDSWNDFLRTGAARRLVFVETGSSKLYTEVQYQADDCLVFGSETKGLPLEVLRDCPDNHISVPMVNPRSLNLANTVAIVLYEAWRQLGFINVLGK
jgi:tRNA (cytidine/uridine-2'-O-)-methyltransferase